MEVEIMKKTDSQVVIEMRFLIITLLVCFLLVVTTGVVVFNWNDWFGKDVVEMNEAKETTLIVK